MWTATYFHLKPLKIQKGDQSIYVVSRYIQVLVAPAESLLPHVSWVDRNTKWSTYVSDSKQKKQGLNFKKPRWPRSTTTTSTCVWEDDVTAVRGGDGADANDYGDGDDDEGHMLEQNRGSESSLLHQTRRGGEASVFSSDTELNSEVYHYSGRLWTNIHKRSHVQNGGEESGLSTWDL